MSVLPRGATLSQPVPPGTVLFHDDFDGTAGAAPDAASWTPDIGRGTFTMSDGTVIHGWGNNELQYYLASQLALDGASHLAVTCAASPPPDSGSVDADHQFISGRFRSQGKREFVPPVRIEARIKWPVVAGSHLAWWTMGGPDEDWPHLGEIDLFEVFGTNPAVRATVMGPTATTNPDDYTITAVDNYALHDAALPGSVAVDADDIVHRTDWLPDSITTYVNGTQWLQATKADFAANGWEWAYDRTAQYLIFMFALQTNPGVGFTSAQALIDYVTVTQL